MSLVDIGFQKNIMDYLNLKVFRVIDAYRKTPRRKSPTLSNPSLLKVRYKMPQTLFFISASVKNPDVRICLE